MKKQKNLKKLKFAMKLIHSTSRQSRDEINIDIYRILKQKIKKHRNVFNQWNLSALNKPCEILYLFFFCFNIIIFQNITKISTSTFDLILVFISILFHSFIPPFFETHRYGLACNATIITHCVCASTVITWEKSEEKI